MAAATRHANQSRRLLSLAAVLEGMDRTTAARIGGMDRQTPRDWVHRFNKHGPDGLRDSWSKGNPSRLSADRQAELARLVEAGPDRAVDGVVRWRRIDLRRIIQERFRVTYHERTVGKVIKALGSAHVSARPRHPTQDAGTVAAFKQTSPSRRGRTWPTSPKASRSRPGSRMKPASARRTGSSANGPGVATAPTRRPAL